MKYPVCCCCAESNQRYYLDRILFWAGQFYAMNYDLHVFCDGNIVEDVSILKKAGISFHEYEKLGRNSSWVFQSYKRNFLMMCKMFPNGFSVVENDVVIFNMKKFDEYTRKDGLFCGFSKKYNFIETAMMILNDKDAIERFIQHYENDGAIYENECFECTLKKVANKKFDSVFTGERKEGDATFDITRDYCAQFF